MAPSRGAPGSRLLGPFVALVALHSAAVGGTLALFPRWAAAFGGFDPAGAGFFTRQGGVFHLVLAAAYALEWRALGTVRLLLLAKGAAVIFLGTAMAAGPAPWAVPVSAAGDAAMLLVALALRRVAQGGGGAGGAACS